MNIEEKAKAYDEALEKATTYYDNAKVAGDYSAVARYENIFPELAESDDERIRKAIMGLTYIDGIEPILTKCSITAQDIRKYLEKQKEQKPVEWSEEDEKRLNAVGDLLNNTSAIHPNYSRKTLIYWLGSLRGKIKED